MAAAADFDGEGSIELLVPFRSLDMLGAIRRSRQGAKIVWTLQLGTPMSSNLAVVQQHDGFIAVGVGLENGMLRLWLPSSQP
jgi:hypothetical protein